MAERTAREPRPKQPAPREGTPPTDGTKRKRRRRPRKKAPAPVEVATRAIEAATNESESTRSSKLPEEPLAREEISVMKRHLRFLREHRKVLNLKVNAQEDLLLNERREPTRRGVCQHLLSKVDRKRVFAAVERLDPEAGMRLVEGVLRIAPDVDYALLYLDCVRRTGAKAQAVAALSEALERIDFAQVSQGQMRRVLDLLVELFDERQRPQVLLGLFEGKAFRDAFDEKARELPEALAALVVPLRAAQAVVLHNKANRHGAARLREGLRLLLHGDEAALLRYPTPVRQRLLELGVQACAGADPVATRALNALLESVSDDSRHATLGLDLARQLIGLEQEDLARELLDRLERAHPDSTLPATWRNLLAAPRMGRVALRSGAAKTSGRGRRRRHRDGAGHPSRLSGVLLTNMRPVWVFTASEGEVEAHRKLDQLVSGLCVPGVAPVVARGGSEESSSREDMPFFAVPHFGPSLESNLDKKGSLNRDGVLRLCSELVAIAGALASVGVVLPDVNVARFEQDAGGRPWLVDLSGAHLGGDTTTMLRHAQGLCRTLLDRARHFIPPADLPESLDDCASFPDLLRAVVPR